MGGDKKSAGGDAAGAIAAANLQGIEELRRQFDVASQNVTPFIEAGIGALGDVTGGATIGGFGERLKELFAGGSLQPLEEERRRAVESGLSARGLSRSGTAIRELADIPTQLGLGIENLLFGRQQNLAGQGLAGGLSLGGLGQQAAGGVANLFSQTGQARGAGIVTDAQAQAEFLNQILGIGGQAAPSIISGLGGLFGGAGIGAAGATGAAGASAGAAAALPIVASFFSDPNLKCNVEEIAEFNLEDESKNLRVYQWDWIPETKDTIVRFYPTMGFMADEVKGKYPQHVHRYAGFDTIDYQSLLNEMEALNETREAA